MVNGGSSSSVSLQLWGVEKDASREERVCAPGGRGELWRWEGEQTPKVNAPSE